MREGEGEERKKGGRKSSNVRVIASVCARPCLFVLSCLRICVHFTVSAGQRAHACQLASGRVVALHHRRGGGSGRRPRGRRSSTVQPGPARQAPGAACTQA